MGRLGDSFHRVSDAYDRGRPRYPPAAVATMLAGLPEAPHAVDVGAGTGQLAAALREAGARVTAIEPGEEPRRLLQRREGIEVLGARAEALPVPDASADLVVCADSFHWFDAGRALGEFRRVLQPGGRLCVSGLVPRWQHTQWAEETGKITGPLWKRADHPLRQTGFDVPRIPPDAGFEETGTSDIPFAFETDRDGLLALFGSWSAVASLPDDERAAVEARLAAVLDRHEVQAVELSYVARLRLYRRQRPPAGGA